MKLRFQANDTTNVESHIIINNVLSLLNDRNYQIREVTNKSVTFSDNPWVFRSQMKAMRRLDGGTFEISVLGNDTSVTLNCYLNILPMVLIVVAVLTLPIILAHDYWASIFFLLFFSVAYAIQVTASKDVAREMIREVITREVES